MPEFVVDALETVDVEVGHRQWLPVAKGQRHFAIAGGHDRPPVQQAGQFVMRGQLVLFIDESLEIQQQ